MTFWHWLGYIAFLALATGAVCWLTERAEDRARRSRWLAELRHVERMGHTWDGDR